jgi:hypothetical protein
MATKYCNMFTLNYNSYYKDLANKKLYWLPMDTRELYEKNLQEKYELLKTNNWIDRVFSYKFNSHGFRCEEFTEDPTIMFLGCSNTCGIGLPIDNIWPEMVSKNLNMRCANLGMGGASNDTTFRMCHGWIDNINPKIVILNCPPTPRLELARFNKYDFLSINQTSNSKYIDEFVKTWITDENNIYFNQLKNVLAIENLCIQNNIKFLKFSYLEFNSFFEDYARDLTHLGVKSNSNFAEHVLSKI